jgi:hypothetical protein
MQARIPLRTLLAAAVVSWCVSQPTVAAEIPSRVPDHLPVETRVVSSDASCTVLDIPLGLSYDDASEPVGVGLVAIPPTCGVTCRVDAITLRHADARGSWGSAVEEPGGGWSGLIQVSEPGIWRDLRVVGVTVRPRPSSDVLVERVRIELRYEGTGPNPLTHWGRPISPEFDRLYRGAVLNYNWLDVEPWSRSDAIRYLIIVADQLVQGGDSLAWWRNLTGMRAQVVSRSQIGGGNPAGIVEIKTYISNAYHSWPQPPEFVVLMGDLGSPSSPQEEMPAYEQTDLVGLGTYASDHWYTLVDGFDYYADVFIGRIPTVTPASCFYVVDKIIQYERDPIVLPGITWQEKALMCAGHGGEFPSITNTKRYVAGKLLTYGYEVVDSVYVPEMPGIDADVMIATAVNQGRGIVNYRGDPTYSWGWTTLDFTNTDVQNYVHNGRRLPFVLSVSCYSGKYQDQTCFGENWLAYPEANGDPKGCVAFFGSTGWTHTHQNNWMDKGISRGMFEEGIARVTEATEYGKMWMLANLGHSDTTENTVREYGVLGDPGTLIWTDRPESLQVVHPDTVSPGPQSLTIWVKDHLGVPLNGALVCAWKDTEVHQYAYTMVGGGINLNINPLTPGTMQLTVTAPNMLPYEGSIQVLADAIPPEAIADLTISVTPQGDVELAWTEVSHDTTGAPETLDHYEVYRELNAYLEPPAGLTPIAMVPDGMLSYIDAASGVGDPAQNHFYCVLAVDQAGNRSAPSNRVGEFDYGSGLLK